MTRLAFDKWWQTYGALIVIAAALATPYIVNPLLDRWLP